MLNRTWLAAAFVLASILAVLQHVAVDNYLFWIYPWFDVPMHYIGGVAIAAFLVALSPKFRPRAFIVLFTLLMIAWELFEYMFGIPREANYVFDTLLDFLMDALGAVTVYVIARFTVWRSA